MDGYLKHRVDDKHIEKTTPVRVILGVVVLLCLLGFFVYGRGLSERGFEWPDCAVHAMDGVLIHDYLAAGPQAWFNPLEFAYQQYARYPALGIGIHYPPAFGIIEAGVFFVLGVSTMSAKATVLGFSLLTLTATFLLLKRICGIAASLIGAAFLLQMPLIVKWTRQAMLEMPTLAALTFSAFFFLRYLDKPSWKRLIPFTLVAAAAPFFKQPAVFLLPVFFVWVLGRRKRNGIPVSHLVSAGIFLLVVVGGFFIVIFLSKGHVVHLVSQGRPLDKWFGWESWSIVLKSILSGAGYIAVVLAIGGLVAGSFRRTRVWYLGVFWLITCVLFNVLVQHKEDRFLFYSLQPLALGIGLLMETILARIKKLTVTLTATAAVLVVCTASGFGQPKPVCRDFLPCVAPYRNVIQDEIIMYVGKREPDFILAVRQILGPKGAMVLRGSKLFYSCASDPRYEYQQYIHTVNEVDDIIERYAPKAIFVEDEIAFGLEPERLVRQYLKQTDKYAMDKSVDIVTEPNQTPKKIHVYLRIAKSHRTARSIDLPVPIINNRIQVDLETLGF